MLKPGGRLNKNWKTGKRRGAEPEGRKGAPGIRSGGSDAGMLGCFKGYYTSLIGAKAREENTFARNNINSQVIYQTAGEHEWDRGPGGGGGLLSFPGPKSTPRRHPRRRPTSYTNLRFYPPTEVIPRIHRATGWRPQRHSPRPGLISDNFSSDLTLSALCIRFHSAHNSPLQRLITSLLLRALFFLRGVDGFSGSFSSHPFFIRTRPDGERSIATAAQGR